MFNARYYYFLDLRCLRMHRENRGFIKLPNHVQKKARSSTNLEPLLLQQQALYVHKREKAMATNTTSGEEVNVAKEESLNANAQENKGWVFFCRESGYLGHLSHSFD